MPTMPYFEKIYNNILCLKNKIVTKKIYNMVILFAFILITSLAAFIGVELFSVQFRYYYLLTAFVIFIIAFVSLDKNSFRKKVPKSFVIFWLIIWGTYLLNTVFISTNFLPIPVLVLFLFPILYFAVPKEKQANLFSLSTKAVSIMLCFFIISSLLIRPFIGRPYVGVFANANYVGQFLTIIFALLMPTINVGDENKWFNYILIGFCAAFTFASLSRTSWLACATVGVLWLIYQAYNCKKQDVKKLIQIILKLIISTILAFVILLLSTAAFFDISGISKLGLPQLEADAYKLLDEETDFAWQDRFSSFAYRINSNFLPDEFYELLVDGDSETDSDTDSENLSEVINSFSSNRIYSWNKYKETVGFIATPESERPYVNDTGGASSDAHNTFFEIAFHGGLLTAIGFVVLKIYLLYKSFFLAVRNKNDKEYLYSLLIVGAMVTTGIFASIYSPTNSLLGFMFYVAIIPIFNHISTVKK